MNEEQSGLPEFLAAARRSAWIVILATLICAVTAYFISARQPKVYSATAQVLVPPAQLSLVLPGSTTSSSVQQARDAATLAQVAKTATVAGLATHALGDGTNPGRLASSTTVTSDPETNVITFVTQNHSAPVATAQVNAYARAFVAYENAQRVKAITSAINSVNAQTAVENHLLQQPDANQVAIGAALAKLVSKRQALATALAVTKSSPASVTKLATGAKQIKPEPQKAALIGVAIGLILGIGLAVLRRVLDTRIRSATDVEKVLDLPQLARLPAPSRSMRSKHGVAVLAERGESSSEDYRKLRLSIEFANLTAKARSLIVTSAVPGEGKSTTVANLGAAFALTGKRVIVVDLDLRKPQLGAFFELGPAPGATQVALGHATLDEALVPVDLGDMSAAPKGMENGSLHVIGAGPFPPNPAEFLGSEAMSELIDSLVERSDLVLIDSAPLLPVGDTIALSRAADGVVTIVRAALVTRSILNDLQRTLKVCEAPILGYVLTGAETESGYGKYGYYGQTQGREMAPSSNGHTPVPSEAAQPQGS